MPLGNFIHTIAPKQRIVRCAILTALLVCLFAGVHYFPYDRLVRLVQRPAANKISLETAVWDDLIGVSADRSQVFFTVHDRIVSPAPYSSIASRSIWRLDIVSGRIKTLEEGHVISSGSWRFDEAKERILYIRRENTSARSGDLCSVDLRGGIDVLQREASYRALDQAFSPNLQIAISSARAQAETSFEPGWWFRAMPPMELSSDRNHFCFGVGSISDGDVSPPKKVVRVATLRPAETVAKFEDFEAGQWSPDARYLVLWPFDRGPGPAQITMTVFDTVQRERFSIIVASPDANRTRQAYPVGPVSFHNGRWARMDCWSPDSRRLLIITRERNAEAGVDGDILWVVDLEERRVVREFRDAFYPHHIEWSPEGRWLATKSHYVSGNDEVSDGWLLNVETGERVQLPMHSVEAVVWLDSKRVLWAKRQPYWGTSIPAVEFYISKLGETDVKRVFPR